MKEIGTIAYTTMGVYSEDVTYEPMFIVLYAGSLWECMAETTGNAPPDYQYEENGNAASNDYWRLFLPGALGDDYVKKTDIAESPTENSQGKAGIVIPDGETITIDEDGTIHGQSKVDNATSEKAGIVKPDNDTIIVSNDGTIKAIKAGFVGTKEEVEEAIQAGEIKEGEFVGITDDYEEGSGGGASITVDNELSEESENPVQNKVITIKINQLEALKLAVMKREIMASYGYFGIEWNLDELMALVRAGKWDEFAIGDYFIETTTTGEKIQWEVAGKNPYLHCGDTPLEAPHIVPCPRDCLQTYYKYNNTNTNTGGYAASLMPSNLETEANKFSSKLQGYMTTIRRLENNKDAWAWASRRIFLPSNPELVGFHGWADEWDGGAFNQFPLFVGGNAHLLKGAGFNKSKAARVWYWTADPSAANTTDFCLFYSLGTSTNNNASNDGGVAPLIVLS